MLVVGFVGGASLASFLHATGWRVRRARNWLSARSVCESCDHVLAAWEIVPVVGWLALRGRCHHCHTPIPRRHLAVEAAGGLLGLATALWLT